MGDRLVRAWRLVRHPTSVRSGAAAVTGRAAGYAPPAPRRSSHARRCNASGWQMRSGCGDGAGGTICPLCSQRVRTYPEAAINRGIEVIQAHCA